MTKFELRHRLNELWGCYHWARRGRPGDRGQLHRVAIIRDYRQCRAMLARGEYQPEINERGNEVLRDIDADEVIGSRGSNRYHYDFGPLKEWQQYDTDQDAHYFGVWVDLNRLRVFTYAEGDRILVKCPNRTTFQAELEDMERFYGPPPPVCVVVTTEGRTDYCLPRPSLAAA